MSAKVEPVVRSSDGIRGAIDVLVVDDSAVVRQFMVALLGERSETTVRVASDPVFALRKIAEQKPDVILLDLEMPRMDGLTFLRQLMATEPIPVVICSGHTGKGTEKAMIALEEGAVEVIGKPKFGLKEFLSESNILILDAIVAAAGTRVFRRARPARLPHLPADAVLPLVPRAGAFRQAVVAIGASIGGPEALERILSQLPSNSPPILIVQHMPEQFTRALAKRLDKISRLRVVEAQDGERVRSGTAYIAQGNRHLILGLSGERFFLEVKTGPLVSRHRPSADVLFRSVAASAGAAAIGALLTGMGNDGAQGLLEMKNLGAHTLVQDEASSVVFGMPRAAIELGAAAEVRSLGDMAVAIQSQFSLSEHDPCSRK